MTERFTGSCVGRDGRLCLIASRDRAGTIGMNVRLWRLDSKDSLMPKV